MNEILGGIGWLIRGVELLLLLFMLIQFKKHRWNLFFGGKTSCMSSDENEMHSSFICIICVLFFYTTGQGLASSMLELQELDKFELRRLFYFSLNVNAALMAGAIYVLHRIRKCRFSITAKRCLHLIVLIVLINTIQLIARGYFDFNGLQSIYRGLTVGCNLLALFIVAVYPVTTRLNKIKKEKEA
ncbi:hypothetical protein A7985_05530 [Pseudoalteromonas luteoviolacea]|uniref:Uncharacterized protein n=1 Tax=Pseudoalteromonas luteoviolacea TaxID=43657 RepID=A0A1C0TVS8_9GAMM|nr:hypothetical protein [Pseudoalteromonas luteoviolacea]OCQ23401.1 hypothetical protein A7985_05530 [Pseudoalteromonas luteoviolacea]